MLKKLTGIVGGIIGIVGFVMCVISVFVSVDSIQKILVKVAVALIICDVIVIGICTRIFQVKDSVGEVKKVFKELKQSSAPSRKDSDELDFERRALEEKQHNRVISTQSHYISSTSNYPEWFKYLNLALIILFLLIIASAAVLFFIKQHVTGVIMVGCGFADIILLCIINSIAEKRAVSKRFDIEDAKIDVLNSALPKTEVPIQLVEASVSDAQGILEMQRRAFAELLKKYGDYGTSPANETLSKVESRFQDPNTYHYFIKADDKTVGVIRVIDPKSQEKKRLAQIFIMPEYRLKGYAHSTVKKVEEIHGSTGWELDTILQERRLLTFYMRLGYRVQHQTKRINSQMILVVMEK